MKAGALVILSAAALSGCKLLQPSPPIYPHPEPDEADETQLSRPRCDLTGIPRDCYYNVHFQQRGGVTVMLAPQCVQVTITNEPATGDPTHARKAQTIVEPHEVMVVGDRDEHMQVGLCLQFPLREPQTFNWGKPAMSVDPRKRHCFSTEELMNGRC